MDNITHSLAGGLLAEMGLRKRSRFAFAACLLGANAPDIDVFAPLVLPVDGMAFHRGPIHAVFAWPILAAGIVGILWLVDRWKPRRADTPEFRPWPLFLVALLAVLTHPFLDWLTTYAIALFAPLSERWYSGDAIFIIDWVYWLLMGVGIALSARRCGEKRSDAGRPAQIAGVLMLGYILFNLGESQSIENAVRARLRTQGIEATLVVASPPPFYFWDRSIAWQSADRWGRADFHLASGLAMLPGDQPRRLDDPRLAAARARDPHVAGFLVWSRMPALVDVDGKTWLTDLRYYDPAATSRFGPRLKAFAKRHSFLVALDREPGRR